MSLSKTFLLIRNFILGQNGIGQGTFSVELSEQNSPPYNGWVQLRDLVDVTFPQPVGHGDQQLQVDQVPFTEMKATHLDSTNLVLFANKFNKNHFGR
jgi:hypothetical protein